MRYLIGPELLWLLIYGGANLVAKANTPHSKAINDFIQTCWFWIPVLSLLTFALWWAPVVEKRWLLLRVWAACVVGCHYSLEKVIGASSTQGPGAGMAWLVGMMLLFVILVVGSIVVKIKF